MKLLEGSAGRTKPRTLSPKPYTTLARLGPEELHHVLTHNNTFRTVRGMGRKKRLKWFKLYKQEDNKDNKDNRNMSREEKRERPDPPPDLGRDYSRHPPICAPIRMYWSNHIQQAKTRSTTLDFVSFAPLDQTLVVVHEDFRLGNDPPFDPEEKLQFKESQFGHTNSSNPCIGLVGPETITQPFTGHCSAGDEEPVNGETGDVESGVESA